MKRAKQNKNRR